MKFITILILTLSASSAFAERPVCRSEKFERGFGNVDIAQATACENDGSMEFCLPRGELALQARIQSQYPNVACFNGSQSRGHIDCASYHDEVLCIYKIPRGECVDRKAMTDAGWDRFCSFSQVEEIERIGPTWYE